MEFLKDYDCTILYHLEHGNEVLDSLSRSVPTIVTGRIAREWKLLEAFSLLIIVLRGLSTLTTSLMI